ncbi:MAG: hypothetical protein ACK5NG_05880 [Chthoniobacterales bacterium]
MKILLSTILGAAGMTSLLASTALDFSNGSSTVADGGSGRVIYSQVTAGEDLMVTADSHYATSNAAVNGTVNSDDYQLNLAPNVSTEFTFSFVDSMNHLIPVLMDSFNISILDLDLQQEVMEIHTYVSFTVRDDHSLTSIDTSDPTKITFQGKSGGQIANPTDSSNLTAAQERVAINLHFADVSAFKVTYSTLGAGGG